MLVFPLRKGLPDRFAVYAPDMNGRTIKKSSSTFWGWGGQNEMGALKRKAGDVVCLNCSDLASCTLTKSINNRTISPSKGKNTV